MSKWYESNSKVFRIFKWSVAALLLTTSLAKFVTSGSNASQHWPDPVFGVPFRDVLWMAGLVELAGAVICLASRSVFLAMGTTAWLATNLLLYRVGLWWVGSPKPCGCLGGLTDGLHLSVETVNVILKIIVAYMLVGSYSILIAHCWQKLKITSPVLPDKLGEVAG